MSGHGEVCRRSLRRPAQLPPLPPNQLGLASDTPIQPFVRSMLRALATRASSPTSRAGVLDARCVRVVSHTTGTSGFPLHRNCNCFPRRLRANFESKIHMVRLSPAPRGYSCSRRVHWCQSLVPWPNAAPMAQCGRDMRNCLLPASHASIDYYGPLLFG